MSKPYSPKLPPKNPMPPSQRGDKQFEKEIFELLKKYDLFGKIKCKCKKGCIQIERIGQ